MDVILWNHVILEQAVSFHYDWNLQFTKAGIKASRNNQHFNNENPIEQS